ncbi:sugar MFS transporter [Saccharophagus degradans]|uniref:sugar MFS transporter n=1 Tax=Saccharophagus degradans TaxID=86304 RepID=UPI0024780D20|nr:sugar MFS transporter [Saccharophagus degradans]WGO97547.1 sugar MFS transporter [Saccharophagus degradans]
MASIPGTSEAPTTPMAESTQENHTVPLIILTSLFFMWGFLTVMNDVLIPHLKNYFDLSYTQASLIQFCFFGAYGIMSIPASMIVKRIGYQNGAVLGLIIAGLGCFMFFPAAELSVYAIFLGALFVLASGITILQVSANPYVTRLGSPSGASQRLTLTQAFNSLGTTIGPKVGGLLILGGVTYGATELATMDAEAVTAYYKSKADAVKMPYVFMGLSLVGLAVFFRLMKLPKIVDAELAPGGQYKKAWEYKHLILGAVGIFMYVGGEVSIGSWLINLLADPNVAGLDEEHASALLMYFWGGAMVGRFVGAFLMTSVAPQKLLTICAIVVVALLFSTSFTSGKVAMYSVIAIGLFNSIMFPTIFSLALNRLGAATSEGSGILCVAIVGGAFIPLAQGVLADSVGIQLSYLLPIVCYAYIAFYGFKGYKAD